MIAIFDLLIAWLSMFLNWFAELVLFKVGGMPVYLFEVLIFGAIILPFFFTLLRGGLNK